METDPATRQAIRTLAHTLRNIMSPAMMLAERLSDHQDPAVQRDAKLILDTLDKATAALKDAVLERDDFE